MIIDGFNNDTVYNIITVPGPPGPGAGHYLGTVSSQDSMVALTGGVGDYCFRTDLGMFYFLMPPGTGAPWSGLTIPIPASQLASDVQADLALAVSAMKPLSTTTIVTASTSPVINQTTYYNATSGNLTPTLPALSGLSVGDRLSVRRDPADYSPNTVTLSCAGANTFYSSGAVATTLPLSGEQRDFVVISVSGTKYWAPSGPINPKPALDDQYLGAIGPADYGWRGWSHDLAACATAGNTPVAGVVALTRLPVRTKQTITNLIIGITSAGAGLTSGQNFAGLYQNGNLLSATADQTTPWQSAGIKTMALSTPQVVDPANGPVYSGFYANGTTRPTIVTAAAVAALVFLAPTYMRYAYDSSHTGRTTSLPSTLGTLAVSTSFWAAWS